MKMLPAVLALLMTSLQGMAQADAEFKLTIKNGHFYFETSVNGVNTPLMVETGLPWESASSSRWMNVAS